MGRNSEHNRRRVARLTVDLDHASRLRLLSSYFNARHLFPEAPIKVTETGQGHHIRVFQAGIGVEDNLKIRANLGDDKGRLWFDEMRIRIGLVDWVDTLFQAKFKDGKWSREEPCNVLAEPFWSKLPSRKNHK